MMMMMLPHLIITRKILYNEHEKVLVLRAISFLFFLALIIIAGNKKVTIVVAHCC
jgi:hypothetical protein